MLVYSGQFANGFEHGTGKRSYKDGSVYEGRFRFGRRDGPGVLVYPNGTIQKVDPVHRLCFLTPTIGNLPGCTDDAREASSSGERQSTTRSP
jgi:hypothetical protein